MTSFDRSYNYTTTFWFAIVRTALSSTIFEFLNVEECHDIERSLKIIGNGPFDRSHTSSYIGFHSNCGPILYHFRDKARNWSKIVNFFIPISVLEVKGSPRSIVMTFSTEKTVMVALPRSEKSLRICLLAWIQYTNVTDGRTDTARRHRLCHS